LTEKFDRTNFAKKNECLRQINPLKEERLTRNNLKQAKKISDKLRLLRPKKSRANCRLANEKMRYS
jgi:hypothetical protein